MTPIYISCKRINVQNVCQKKQYFEINSMLFFYTGLYKPLIMFEI